MFTIHENRPTLNSPHAKSPKCKMIAPLGALQHMHEISLSCGFYHAMLCRCCVSVCEYVCHTLVLTLWYYTLM